MELKRYVLNQKNEIIDVQKHDEEIDIVGDGIIMFTNKHGWRFEGECIKTSDNILDLVEAGDLLGNKQNKILQFQRWEYHANDEKGKPSWAQLGGPKDAVYTRWYTSEIMAIYKLQPNGDYKRYEVKK